MAVEPTHDLRQLERLAALPDRSALLRRLIGHGGPGGSTGLLLGLLVIDLQRFRSINDALGHARGDEVLAEVARRLDLCRPEGSSLAWLGSSRFALFYDAFLSAKEAQDLAGTILHRLAEPYPCLGHRLVLSTVIGLATAPETRARPIELLRDAETALFSAKAERRRMRTFTPSLRFESVARFQVENELRQAIARQELELHYQPIVQVRGGSPVGVEALVRWRHPRRGLLAPRDFLPLARELGIGGEIDVWALREACHQLAAWRRRDAELARLTVSVNFFADHLSDRDVPALVAQVLEETGLSPADLKLECTENVPMDPTRPATTTALRRMGVGLHIDDFGTGFSCLSHLHRIPAEALKVDRSFVAGLPDQEPMKRLVKTVLELAGDLGVEVIAEGVETREQLEVLEALGCRLAQGFLFSRPLPAEDLLTHFRKAPAHERQPR